MMTLGEAGGRTPNPAGRPHLRPRATTANERKGIAYVWMPVLDASLLNRRFARYAKQLLIAMRPRRRLGNVTEMAIAANGHLRPVYASGPIAR
jgi:hypothetical protein